MAARDSAAPVAKGTPCPPPMPPAPPARVAHVARTAQVRPPPCSPSAHRQVQPERDADYAAVDEARGVLRERQRDP